MDYKEMFLDYANNFLTVARFAEHYELTAKEANNIIDEGRKQYYSEIETF